MSRRYVPRLPMAGLFLADGDRMNALGRRVGVAALLCALGACDRVFTASPAERVGYLHELLRARMIASDSLQIDGCSVDRFMQGVPAWRDSLVSTERALVIERAPCPPEITPVKGRFVLTSWYRNWTGEYVIRGATTLFDESYRFADGIFVGRDAEQHDEAFGAVQSAQSIIHSEMPTAADSVTMKKVDSIRSSGAVFDTLSNTARDTAARVPPADSR
jgi:hypothetical protein